MSTPTAPPAPARDRVVTGAADVPDRRRGAADGWIAGHGGHAGSLPVPEQVLAEHLGRLHAAGLLLTGEPRRAGDLLTATFTTAFAAGRWPAAATRVRPWPYRLLLGAYTAHPDPAAAAVNRDTPTGPGIRPLVCAALRALPAESRFAV